MWVEGLGSRFRVEDVWFEGLEFRAVGLGVQDQGSRGAGFGGGQLARL